jgi:HEAT repeat protein
MSVASFFSSLVLLTLLAALTGCGEQRSKPYIEALSHPDRQIRLEASYNLVMIGVPAVPPLLSRLQAGASDSLLYIGTQILGRIGDPSAIPFLKSLLGTDDPFVRREVVLALGKMGDATLLPTLSSILQTDTEAQVRAAAAQSLPNLRDTSAVAVLMHALQDSATAVRHSALAGLNRLWSGTSETAALAALHHKDETTRYIAVQILSKRRVVAALEDLSIALADSSVWVRLEAARALGRLNDLRAVPSLEKMLKRYNGPDSDEARRSLRALTGMDYVVLQ